MNTISLFPVYSLSDDLSNNLSFDPLSDGQPIISVAVSPGSVTENGADKLVFTFSRTGNITNALDVLISIEGTASNYSDYSQTGINFGHPQYGDAFYVHFEEGSETTTVTVKPYADNELESDETVTLRILENPDNSSYGIGINYSATGTIIEPPPPLPLISISGPYPDSLADDIQFVMPISGTPYVDEDADYDIDQDNDTATFTITNDDDIQFVMPIGGTPYVDWEIGTYFDHDFDPNKPYSPNGSWRDYKGGERTYDGHTGTDFGLSNFIKMDEGVPVFAAASGTVIEVHDGEFDRNAAGNIVSFRNDNHVWIDHGQGIITRYHHLKKNSVSVAVGDDVSAGQKIGEVGSSGNSSGPHLHFEVYENGTPIDPLENADRWWKSDPPPYIGDIWGSLSLNHGISNRGGSWSEIYEGLENHRIFRQEAGQSVFPWVGLYGGPSAAPLRMTFRRPNGSVYSTWDSQGVEGGWWMGVTELPNNPDLGVWTVDVSWHDELLFQDTFEVISNTAPALSINDVTIQEGTNGIKNAIFTVTRTGAVGIFAPPITVDYATTDGWAEAGSDYTATSGTLTFESHETEKTISVPILGDLTPEPSEYFFVRLTNPTNAVLLDYQGVGAIPQTTDLELYLTSDQATAAVNDIVTLTVRVRNKGHEQASSVKVRIDLPQGLNIDSSDDQQDFFLSQGGVEYNSNNQYLVDWNVGYLENPSPVNISEATLQIKVKVAASGSLLTQAEVRTVSEADPDSKPNNDSDPNNHYKVKEDDQACFIINNSEVNVKPHNIELKKRWIPGEVTLGSVLGEFRTEDKNTCDTFTYNLIEGEGDDDNDKFYIALDNQLYNNFAFNRESLFTYHIRVRTTDQGGLFYDQQITLEKVQGVDWGDVHLITFDGRSYDLQSFGEFILVESTVDDWKIQARQEPWITNPNTSINTAFATLVDGHRVVLDMNLESDRKVKIDGNKVTLVSGQSLTIGNSQIERQGNVYTLTYAGLDSVLATGDDDQFIVWDNGDHLNMKVLPSYDRVGLLQGLLGNADGLTTNDFALRNGTQLSANPSIEQLHGEYANSWRITSQESLFVTPPPPPSNPTRLLTLGELDPQAVRAAQKLALEAGIPQGAILDAVAFDLAATHNINFLQGAIALFAPTVPQATVNTAIQNNWTTLLGFPTGPITDNPSPVDPTLTTIMGTNKADTLTGTTQNERLVGLLARDILTGGGGDDIFAYNSLSEAGDTITDFSAGDRFDISQVLDSIGYTGTDPLGDKYVRFLGRTNLTTIQIDVDGLGSTLPKEFVLVQGVDVGVLNNPANFIF